MEENFDICEDLDEPHDCQEGKLQEDYYDNKESHWSAYDFDECL